MSQLTIYLDDQSMKTVKSAAKNAHMSVSRWAREKLTAEAKSDWSKSYINVIGSLSDADIERPSQGYFRQDACRGQL